MSTRRTVLSITATAAAVATLAGVSAAVFLTDREQAGPAPLALADVKVLSVAPGTGERGVSGTAPIQLYLAAAVARGSALPRVSPAVAGSWHESGRELVFDPATSFAPDTRVTVTVPRVHGVLQVSYTTGSYSLLRLQQLLAQLGYLPLTWRPSPVASPRPVSSPGPLSPSPVSSPGPAASPGTGGTQEQELQAAYTPPAGTFSWDRGYPRRLTTLWQAGSPNLITTGAVMAFQSVHGMTTDGRVSAKLWTAVLHAAERGQANPDGYTYAVASKNLPETLTIWHDGREVLRTYANTGIGVAPTGDGTFPVYLRYYFQIMQGTNPDGSHYADPVYYVSYFDGGEAVHYFPRYSYGWPQSLGCVELPWGEAQKAWPYLTYGSLVTVTE